jgi:chemotaxis protein methyltransferase CheR
VSPARPAPAVEIHVREIDDGLFERFRALIYHEAGIALGDGKKSLFISRMAGRLRELGLSSFEQYYRIVANPDAVEERGCLLDRICTNETQFFRDPRQWQFLDEHAFACFESEMDGHGVRRIRAWSAACSSGEEPYSLAMALLNRFPPTAGWRVEVVGTDLSSKVLALARAGVWPIEKSSDIPSPYRRAFMLKGTGSQSGRMKAGPELRDVVSFARLNLNDAVYPVTGQFDLIFCRNVLIYFDRESKSKVIDRLLTHLAPGGYLFMGYAETTATISDRLESVGPNVYARVGERTRETGRTP